jgi:FMN phosphatase YigB (HAD superfamily)
MSIFRVVKEGVPFIHPVLWKGLTMLVETHPLPGADVDVSGRSVLFVDLDHTVLEGPCVYAVLQEACGELARKTGLPLEEIRQMVKWENVERMRNPAIPAVLAMDWDDIVQAVASLLDVSLEANIREFVESHVYSPYARVLEHADEILRALRKPHRSIVAATRGLGKYQIPVLEKLDLLPHFDDVLTPDSSNALKHQRAFYGSWPDRTDLQIVVGDSYADDVVAPHHLGFKTIWKPHNCRCSTCRMEPSDTCRCPQPRQERRIRPDAKIRSLSKLPAVVERLEKHRFCVGDGLDQTLGRLDLRG